jgi:subtilase family serine protease/RNA polymerase subunit RPABC4/transcription elongation factor Spt4
MVPGAGQALSPSEVDGDIFIGEDFTNSTWDVKGTVHITGDLIIRAGGVVNVTDGVLNFRSYDGHIGRLIIEDGGRLNLLNATLQAQHELYNVQYSLGVLVRNGGMFHAQDSNVNFNGHLVVDDASFIAMETVISGPLFTSVSSQVELYDSEMIDIPGRPMREESVYSYDFAQATNDSFDVSYMLERNPSVVSSGQDVALIQMNDSKNVTLGNGQELTITGFDIGGLIFNEGEAASVVLKAEYRTADDFVSGGTPDTFAYSEYLAPALTDATNMEVVETYEASNPSATNREMVLSEDLTGLSLSSIDLSVLTVSLTNTKTQDVIIDRVWVEVLLVMPAYQNINIAGTSEFTAVNSYLAVNHFNYTEGEADEYDNLAYKYRKLVAYGAAQANLYGVTVDGDYLETGVGPYVVVQDSLMFKPMGLGSSDTSGESSVYDLINDNTDTYFVVPGGTTLNTQSFIIGGIPSELSTATIVMRYSSVVGYNSNEYLQWNTSTTLLTDSGLLVSPSLSEITISWEMLEGTINNAAQLADVNLVFDNPDNDPISINWLGIVGVFNPSINIYRWLNASVVDSNNLPVTGAYVNATESLTGLQASYYYNNSVSNVPPQGVLEYLAKDDMNFMITDVSGMANIPLLTDVINADWVNNSYAIPNYKIMVEYTNSTGSMFTPQPAYSTFKSYPNINAADQMINLMFKLDQLLLDLPDIQVLNITTNPLIIYQGDEVTVAFQVTNTGLTTASEFTISVVDSIGAVTNELATMVITNLLPGEVRDISLIWMNNLTTPGTHSIIVRADTLNQVVEYNENNVLTAQVVVLKFLPDLAITGASIEFSANPAVAQRPMYINVTVSNLDGRMVAQGAIVRYYLGNPLSGGKFIGSTIIDVAYGGDNVTHFLWTPDQIGAYPIYVTVNEGGLLEEYSYSNNMASNTLVVVLEADINDWLVDIIWPDIIGAQMTWEDRNIIVEENGYLALIDTYLFVRQQINEYRPLQIVVRDSGTLVLNNTTIDSNMELRVYLFDNSNLVMAGSSLSAKVVLIMDDSSTVHMDGSFVMGDIQTPSTSSAELVAVNTTFGRSWSYFGGTATAELTGASINSIPPVSPKDGAVVTLYSWIVVSVYDGTGIHKIPGAYVEARSFINFALYASGYTDMSGEWRFRALSDIVTAAGHGSVVSGYYQLNGTYWYDGDRYDSDLTAVAEVAYNPDTRLVRSDALVRLDISSAKPNLDPPINAPTNPVWGSTHNISTVVNNIGVVTAYDITVRFKDNTTGWFEDVVIDELPAMSNLTVEVAWTATYPLGIHILSVFVDPLNEIPELDEGNNYASTEVNVTPVSDLVITAENIVLVPEDPVLDQTTQIFATVQNIGDNFLGNDSNKFTVRFYDNDLNTSIGFKTISVLLSGQSETVFVDWTPSTPGNHIIIVEVDRESLVNESTKANNLAQIEVTVLDYPDLLVSSISFAVGSVVSDRVFVNSMVSINAALYNIGESAAEDFYVTFTLNGTEQIGVVHVDSLAANSFSMVSITWKASVSDNEGLYQNKTIGVEANPDNATHIAEMDDDTGNANNFASQVLQVVDNRPDMAASNGKLRSAGVEVASATIGENVQVTFDITNVGIIDGTGLVVTVTLTNGTMSLPLYSQVVNIAAGDSVSYDVLYLVNVTSGDYSIVIDVDAGSDSDQDDNTIEVDMEVTAPTPFIALNMDKFDFSPGTNMYVQGKVTKTTASGVPLVGLDVLISIVDGAGYPLAGPFTVTTNSNGEFSTFVPVPSGKEGSQILLITVLTLEGETDKEQSINIIAPFTPETIPTWVYLMIVALVIAVIVIFSLYLYRVGLSRMVECGNCGALIPESSRHCPKCGVEFESNTAKCSECGAWIPSEAESCPECGAKFMTEPVEAGQAPGYIEAMRKRYDEYIDGFRGQAKAALASKYSEEKFLEWLQTEPSYLPFEEWLRKEEMARKSGVFPCPSCGTLNPKDSNICIRCGTVFDQVKEQPVEEQPKAEGKKSPFRRIVRRSGEAKEQPKAQPQEEKPAEQALEEPKPEEGEDKPQ